MLNQFMHFKATINTLEKQKIIQDELKYIEEIIIPNDKLFKIPTFPLEKLMTERALEKFRTILEGYIAKV